MTMVDCGYTGWSSYCLKTVADVTRGQQDCWSCTLYASNSQLLTHMGHVNNTECDTHRGNDWDSTTPQNHKTSTESEMRRHAQIQSTERHYGNNSNTQVGLTTHRGLPGSMTYQDLSKAIKAQHLALNRIPLGRDIKTCATSVSPQKQPVIEQHNSNSYNAPNLSTTVAPTGAIQQVHQPDSSCLRPDIQLTAIQHSSPNKLALQTGFAFITSR